MLDYSRLGPEVQRIGVWTYVYGTSGDGFETLCGRILVWLSGHLQGAYTCMPSGLTTAAGWDATWTGWPVDHPSADERRIHTTREYAHVEMCSVKLTISFEKRPPHHRRRHESDVHSTQSDLSESSQRSYFGEIELWAWRERLHPPLKLTVKGYSDVAGTNLNWAVWRGDWLGGTGWSWRLKNSYLVPAAWPTSGPPRRWGDPQRVAFLKSLKLFFSLGGLEEVVVVYYFSPVQMGCKASQWFGTAHNHV